MSLVIIVSSFPVVGVGFLTILLLYQTALDVQRERLVETAKSQARLIESIARYSARKSGMGESQATDETLSQLKEAHRNIRGFGDTGEFTLAKREENQIVFLLRHRHFDLDRPLPVSFASSLAEPMRQALLGRSGTLVGLDYRDAKVLAAFEPVAGLDWGLVAKIDLSEVRAPFIKAGLITLGVVLLAVSLGSILIFRLFNFLHANLHRQEQEARSILNATKNGILFFDESGMIQGFNKAAEDMFGYKASEVTGKHLSLLFPVQSKENRKLLLETPWGQADNTTSIESMPLKGIRRDGEVFPLEITFRLLEGNKASSYLGIAWDISDRVKADAQKDEFISTVSHELRTPLTSIAGALGIIMGMYQQELSDDVSEMMELAQRNADQLGAIINDLLDIQKLDAGKMEMEMKPILLADLLLHSVSVNKSYAGKFGVSLVVHKNIPQVYALGDWVRLTQVLSNLISNAVKFSPQNSVVRVSMSQKDSFAQISVTDQGMGISKDFQDKVFEKFSQQYIKGQEKGKGTGLGLNISKAIVEYHDGMIQFTSVPDKGTTFTVDLPIISPGELSESADVDQPATEPTGLLS